MTDLFLNYLQNEKNRSEQTIVRYARSLSDFESYFLSQDASLCWSSVDSDIIRGWVESRMDAGLKATTVNADVAAVRSFYRFALSRGLVAKDPACSVCGPKKDKPLPYFVKESDMDKLLDEEEWDDTYNDVCVRTIIMLFYEAGLRCSELTRLDDADVNFEVSQLKVTGKRNKQRIIPFGIEVARELRHYMEVRDAKIEKACGALFLNSHGQRVSNQQVYQYVKGNLSKVTMMKKRSPHVLRHSFATAMLNHGASLESVRQMLGHESLETTQIYTHLTFDQMRRVYKETHPRG